MQTFRFPLERVLNWRRTAFVAEEARLGNLLAEQKRLDMAREEILAAWERAGRELLATGAVDGSELAALSGFRAHLERQRAANERQRAEARDRITAQRARIIEAHRRFRLLEKLRSRRMEEWHVAENREMETFASEAFLARWRPPPRRGAN
jgi:flagellar export protein FliJ